MSRERGRWVMRADRACGVALALGACGHTAGTLLWTAWGSALWVWMLSGALAAALLSALNLLRTARPRDGALATIAVVGSAAWVLVALAFGRSIGRVADPRVVMHAASAAALVAFGVRTVREARGAAAVQTSNRLAAERG